MSLSAPGIGSNLDINGIISQLMAIERQPLNVLDRKKSQYNAQLSAYGKLKSDLSAFQSAAAALKDADDFKVFTATAADTTLLSASASGTASIGKYALTITTLAKAQKLITNTTYLPLTDKTTTTLGTGTLTIGNGTSSFAVTIDGTNNTLEGIQNAINDSSSNYGVTASIMNDGTYYRLVLTPNDTGTANDVTVAVTDTGDSNNTDTNGLSRLSYTAGGYNLTQNQAATDAALTVDGVSITKSSNTISDVIEGVTLNLLNTGTTNLDVTKDTDAITTKVNDFISAYNKLITTVDDLHKKGGDLEADNTVLTIQSRLASVFNSKATITGNAYSYLAEVGVAFQKDGKLSLTSTDFEEALDGNFNHVVGLFTDSTEGFAQRLYTEAYNLLQPDGVIDARTDGIDSSITTLDLRRDQVSARLALVEQRLRSQFSALDALLGSMSQTSNYLMSQLR